jgi:hypothetical protein
LNVFHLVAQNKFRKLVARETVRSQSVPVGKPGLGDFFTV